MSLSLFHSQMKYSRSQIYRVAKVSRSTRARTQTNIVDPSVRRVCRATGKRRRVVHLILNRSYSRHFGRLRAAALDVAGRRSPSANCKVAINSAATWWRSVPPVVVHRAAVPVVARRRVVSRFMSVINRGLLFARAATSSTSPCPSASK